MGETALNLACEVERPAPRIAFRAVINDHDIGQGQVAPVLTNVCIISPPIPQCLVLRPQSLFPSLKSVCSCSTVPVSCRVRCNPGDDYKLLHSLGEGAYGTVVAALHKPSGRQVAIKKVLPFEHTLFCLRTLRELKLLRFFSESCVNENVCCTSCFVPHGVG